MFTLAVLDSRQGIAESTSRLQISVRDPDGEPLPCRIHLYDQRGTAQEVAGCPFWHDHFVCSGLVTASLAPGKYDYAIERGPEYQRKTGQLEMVAGEDRKLNVKLERVAHLRAAGWYSGDLHVHRPLGEVEQLMRAEDLDFAPVITWWNTRNLWKEQEIPQHVVRKFDVHRIHTAMAGEDEREGGALLYFGLRTPLDIESENREVPSPMQFVKNARQRDADVWIDIEKPFWWDVPVWLASGLMNSIGVANNHMCRSQMYPSEAWGKPRDDQRLPPPLGNGFWTQEIYYHMLNSGLRVPPSAGSASGVLPNPVGYNRVYVHLQEPFSRNNWFRGLSRGRCFLTNGPLLIVSANGDVPGAVFRIEANESMGVHLEISLTAQDPISRIELIQNGSVTKTVPCDDKLNQQHSLDFSVDASGWFLVRVIAEVDHTFRFATTAPWFVEAGAVEHRISRESAQFFLTWVNERIERVEANVADEQKRHSVLQWHEQAREFWTQRLEMANVE